MMVAYLVCMEDESVVSVVSRKILAHAATGMPLVSAARIVKAEMPNTCLKAMEIIGCYPSSEPELAALQRVWP